MPRSVVQLVFAGLFAAVVALLVQTALAAPAEAFTNVDLSTYKRVGRYDLPEPTRTAAPANNLLAQEASAVTYDWDTDTLFVAGDGGTAIVQVSKTGALINTMTLPPGSSPQGTEFYDTEGLAYVGNGEFVFTEERNRTAVRFTYVPGGTLTRAAAKTVKLGTTIGNIGLEGVTNDPITGGYIFVKEIEPKGIFQTGIDWEAGTATNGSPTTTESTNLFDPALVPTIDFSDVFSLANVSNLTGPQRENLLIISQESGKVVDVNRSGVISSSLTLIRDPGNPLTIPAQTHEGVTMDNNGVLYTVNENGGGDANHPQLWVFESQSVPNQAPTGVSLTEQTTSLPETTSTSSRLRLAEPVVADDGYGSNQYSVTGADASFFEVDSNGLYLKAGTTLNAATKSTYNVNVSVQDPTVSGSSSVTVPYTLTITSSSGSSSGTNVAVTEVSPWSSGESPYKADWWELTNTGTKKLDLTGWKMDDDSASFASAVALNGVSSLAPGESAVFIEGTAATAEAFKTTWFGASPPAGFKIGFYSGSGVGLSTGGDQVNIFNAAEARVTGVAFGASTTGQTFDNTAAAGSATAPLPVLTTLSSAGVNGAFTVGSETGSPGVAPVKTPVIVSEVAPWGSGTEASAYAADWWELTNISSQTVDLTGWKMDDESNSFGVAVALNGVSSLAPGESAIFIEGESAKASLFKTFWFGSSVPAGFQIGTYSGAGVGLGTGGDQVNVFNSEGAHLTGVKFGASTTNVSFDNAAGLGSYGAPPAISTLSVSGVNGAFVAHDETGSPGRIKTVVVPPLPSVKITEVSSASSSNTTYKADWWELTNTGATTVSLEGWKMDDDSSAFASAVALTGVTSIAAGESVVFIEGTAATAEAFKTTWFGASPPAGFKIGSYSGSGVGLSSSGDQVNVFNSEGTKVTGVRFGAAGANTSFDNAAGIGSPTESPPPLISTLSVNGVNGAFVASGETGSPGTIKNPPPPLPSVKITEASSTSSSNTSYKADFWELTNTGASTVSLEGWKMDDDSSSFAAAVALNGVTSLAAGESAIFVEGTASTAEAFKTAWFGASPPAGFKIGTYSGSGVGLSSSGDQVNVFNSEGTKVTGVRFGAGTAGVSFDNAAGIGSPTESPPPLISTLSVSGVNGAFVASGETGSPGTVVNHPPVKVTGPAASGSTYVGSSLSCDPGSWNGVPAPSFGYQWLSNGSPIGSATSSSYTTTAADAGAAISCEVTATNASGSVSAISNAIQIPVRGCNGVSITGAGTTTQSDAQQTVWGPVFPVSVCPSGPTVTYQPTSGSAALAAWKADGAAGPVDNGLSFLGTDGAPSAGGIANIESAAGVGTHALIIPVAQSAIAIVVNPPAGCQLGQITNKQLENTFRGNVKTWEKFDGHKGAGCQSFPLTRVVGGAMEPQFRSYLAGINPASLACTAPAVGWSSFAWPKSGVGGCKPTQLSSLVQVSGDKGADVVAQVNAIEGSIGFAPLADVEDGRSGDTHSLQLQNNGMVKYANGSFAGPATESEGANCEAASYNVPNGARPGQSGESADWTGVSGADRNIRATSGSMEAYSLCELTYVVALDGYGQAGFTQAQAATAEGYLANYVTTAQGQEDLANAAAWLAPLPSSGTPAHDVLGAAQLSASKIGF
ncbi:MAG TPA: lamin tail domain-containing protein [Solirubrobacterales bacterium]|nr:lamin tail domain-containing protein [Solirubrobacterales bacterium]